jgi:hypothetical protein
MLFGDENIGLGVYIYVVPSLGLSGGVLCIWNHSNFCVNSSYVEFNGANLGIETQNLFIYLQL